MVYDLASRVDSGKDSPESRGFLGALEMVVKGVLKSKVLI